ncbi:hypothetical protein J2128_000629 [Methanomicrobium sp. W14]|uniref:hypothetical protein n=1 Tax=Methanomicrobium sp. W14 TaxID=2817839 RepID=UPI001AE2B181|nr:hypothetical protein [Methanomicrobium sp. W14]MBP2132708.1 hypothetical protein [Methanomicrobium sp. W14]
MHGKLKTYYRALKQFCGVDKCQAGKEVSQKRENLNFEVFKEAVNKHGFRYLSLHGWGELLLNPNHANMIKYGSEKEILVNFTTNTTLIRENTNCPAQDLELPPSASPAFPYSPRKKSAERLFIKPVR